MLAIGLGDGSWLEYTWDDARRLTAVENNLGERIEYTLDAQGNRTAEAVRDSTGTLRVRLTDLQDQTLWEGKVSTGLSPERDSAELLQQALGALLRQIPQATGSAMN